MPKGPGGPGGKKRRKFTFWGIGKKLREMGQSRPPEIKLDREELRRQAEAAHETKDFGPNFGELMRKKPKKKK